jgi:hypothetical protein
MKRSDAQAMLNETLLPAFTKERARLDRIDRWVNNKQSYANRGPARREKKYLEKLARKPWLRLVVISAAQMLQAERVYSSKRDVQAMWLPWDRNRLSTRQVPLYVDAIEYGTAYALGLPGDTGARLTLLSPRQMMALYQDPANDEWPMSAVIVKDQPDESRLIWVLDEEKRWTFSTEKNRPLEFLTEEAHGLGVCPVVRYSPRLDLEGRAEGEVIPYITSAASLIKTDEDRLRTQHFNSWRIRTAEGLDEDASDEDIHEARQALEQDDILTGTGDMKFGTLEATDLGGFISAHDSDLESLAATSQTRTAAMTGKLINVSADAINEANKSAYAKRAEFQLSLGGSHVQLLHLASMIEGRMEDAEDYSVRIGWADTDSLTMGAAVDALGKAAQMLGVPPQKLWPLIPGVDQTQADEWMAYSEDHPSDDRVIAEAVSRQVSTSGADL